MGTTRSWLCLKDQRTSTIGGTKRMRYWTAWWSDHSITQLGKRTNFEGVLKWAAFIIMLVAVVFLSFFSEGKGELLGLCVYSDRTVLREEWGGLEIIYVKEHEMSSGVCSTSSPAKIYARLRFSRLCVWILSASLKQPWGLSGRRDSHTETRIWLLWILKHTETCWLWAKTLK